MGIGDKKFINVFLGGSKSSGVVTTSISAVV